MSGESGNLRGPRKVPTRHPARMWLRSADADRLNELGPADLGALAVLLTEDTMLFPAFTPRLSDLIGRLPLFDSFPYISTRLVPDAHHILLLPDTWAPSRLLNALERQVAVNEFDAALVLTPKDAVFLAPGREPAHSNNVPRSSVVMSGKLHPAAQFDPDVLGSRPEATGGVR